MTVSRPSLLKISAWVVGVAAIIALSLYAVRQHGTATNRTRELAILQARCVAADRNCVDLAAKLARAQADEVAANRRTADLQHQYDSAQMIWADQAKATTARYDADLKFVRTSLAETRRVYDQNEIQLASIKLQLTAADAVIDGLRSIVVPSLKEKCDNLDKRVVALTAEVGQCNGTIGELKVSVEKLSGYQAAWIAVSDQLNRAPVRWGPDRDDSATGGNVGKKTMDAVLIKYMPSMDADSRSKVIQARFACDCDNGLGRGLSTPKQPGD